MKNLKFAIICLSLFLLSSCSNNVVNIPSGFVGKQLTPTGFDDAISEVGQINIGDKTMSGQYTSLVLLEATTITVTESFGQAGGNKDGEDRRVMTKSAPLTVDIYVQMAIPTDKKLRNNAFASITPVPSTTERVSVIYLEDVYKRFAQISVRSKVRGIFAHYKDWDSVMVNYDKINAEIGLMVMDVFKSSNIPLDLISVQLSNVNEDQKIWDSKNEQEAAIQKVKSIEAVGKALKENPAYIQIRKWDVIEEIIKSEEIFIIGPECGQKKPVVTIPIGK